MFLKLLVISTLGLVTKMNGQSILEKVSLPNFKTISGEEMRNCIITYRTIGSLNKNKTNVVLWPTWFNGKSDKIATEIVPFLMDTTGLYIIVVDAFGNGSSSSPSNNSAFPEITIRDMVKSQHELLTTHLHLNHVRAIMGVSMGGMQALEWATMYPVFSDNIISIVGSPKLSSYDLIVWKTEIALLNIGANDKKLNELALRMASDVSLLNSYTPSYWLHHAKEENVDSIRLSKQSNILETTKLEDRLCQAKAILKQDIYKSSGKTLVDMKRQIKARTLLIVSKSDHLVNPKSSLDLAQAIGATLVELDNGCGHLDFICQQPLVKQTVKEFLR